MQPVIICKKYVSLNDVSNIYNPKVWYSVSFCMFFFIIITIYKVFLRHLYSCMFLHYTVCVPVSLNLITFIHIWAWLVLTEVLTDAPQCKFFSSLQDRFSLIWLSSPKYKLREILRAVALLVKKCFIIILKMIHFVVNK